MAVAEKSCYFTTDNIRPSVHAVEQWERRFPDRAQRPVDVAWRDATPVINHRYAPRLSARYVRVLDDPPAVLISHRDLLLTVLYAALEPRNEQRAYLDTVPGLDRASLDRQREKLRSGEYPMPKSNGAHGVLEAGGV